MSITRSYVVSEEEHLINIIDWSKYNITLDMVDYGEDYNPNLLSRPSDILQYAYDNDIGKVEKIYNDNGKFCAVGVINHLQQTKNFKIIHFFKQKYGEEYKTKYAEEISDIFFELMKYSDSSPQITFKDCAEFMRRYGL